MSKVVDTATEKTAHKKPGHSHSQSVSIMSTDFKIHLASELVSEQKTVSYRTLARTQKVHVNAAKCMLYEFYHEQNKRKPGSVYATYIVSGMKNRVGTGNGTTKTNGKHDGDEPMPSSPPLPSSSMAGPSQQESVETEHEQVKVRTITLTREENLEGKVTRHLKTHGLIWRQR